MNPISVFKRREGHLAGKWAVVNHLGITRRGQSSLPLSRTFSSWPQAISFASESAAILRAAREESERWS